MKIDKITPQIAALYFGQKCETEYGTGVVDGVFKNGKICVQHEESISILLPENATLLLRRLESITEEEAREVFVLINGRSWALNAAEYSCKDNWLNGISANKIMTCRDEILGYPLVWLYLLEKGFDLLDLIGKGLAKKIQPETKE